MKNGIILLCCIAVGIVIGCELGSGNTPEGIAKTYVQKQFAGLNCDLSGLTYTVTQNGDGSTNVAVSGVIGYKDSIPLEKKNGKWQIVKARAASADSKRSQIHQQ